VIEDNPIESSDDDAGDLPDVRDMRTDDGPNTSGAATPRLESGSRTPRSGRRRPSRATNKADDAPVSARRKKKEMRHEIIVDGDDRLDATMNFDERKKFDDQYVTTFRDTFQHAAHKMILPADAKGKQILLLNPS